MTCEGMAKSYRLAARCSRRQARKHIVAGNLPAASEAASHAGLMEECALEVERSAALPMPRKENIRALLKEWYLHSRFEGRDGPVWGANYSTLIVESVSRDLESYGVSGISMYESRTGKPIKFGRNLSILNADEPPPQIQRKPASIGRIIHGQAW
ncbi:hypothetical protein [Alcaligenes sp. SDU_A2]|uniref:hypothetical protein n=1 Tax=Alcaligenes sp. SDU_A2 TaxID=3136634 RepID=UPI00311DB941